MIIANPPFDGRHTDAGVLIECAQVRLSVVSPEIAVVDAPTHCVVLKRFIESGYSSPQVIELAAVGINTGTSQY